MEEPDNNTRRVQWPWVTTMLTAALAVTPIGQSLIAGTFSGEALSRNIARPILLIALAIAAIFMLLEAGIWRLLAKRRR